MTTGGIDMRRRRVADAFYEILFPRARRAESWSQTDRAYAFLWKKIVGQDLWPGDRILDAAIAREAGVSRTPVREAVQRLVQDGLLEQLPRGVRVARLSADEVAQLYDYWTALEVHAARRAASSVSEDDARRMLAEIARLRERVLAPGGRENLQLVVDYLRHDAALHQLLLHSGGNRYLARAMAGIHGQLSFFHAAGVRIPSRVEQGLVEHEAIVRAVLERDVAASGDAMERHIQGAKRRMLAGFFGVEAEAPPKAAGRARKQAGTAGTKAMAPARPRRRVADADAPAGARSR